MIKKILAVSMFALLVATSNSAFGETKVLSPAGSGGYIDPQTGTYYAPAGPGLVNTRDGSFIAPGGTNTRTGEHIVVPPPVLPLPAKR